MIKWSQLLILLWIFFIHCSQFIVLGTDLFEDGEVECRTLRNPGCLSACRLKITIAFQSFRLSLIFFYLTIRLINGTVQEHLPICQFEFIPSLNVCQLWLLCLTDLRFTSNISGFVLACLYFCKLHTHTHKI